MDAVNDKFLTNSDDIHSFWQASDPNPLGSVPQQCHRHEAHDVAFANRPHT